MDYGVEDGKKKPSRPGEGLVDAEDCDETFNRQKEAYRIQARLSRAEKEEGYGSHTPR